MKYNVTIAALNAEGHVRPKIVSVEADGYQPTPDGGAIFVVASKLQLNPDGTSGGARPGPYFPGRVLESVELA